MENLYTKLKPKVKRKNGGNNRSVIIPQKKNFIK